MIDRRRTRRPAQAGRHDHRADVGQHRRRPGHRGRPAGLRLHLRRHRQGGAREDRSAAGLRGRGGRLPGRRRRRTTRLPTTRRPSGWSRRPRAPSGRTSTPTRPTPRPTSTPPGPRSGEQTDGKITHFVAGAGTGGTTQRRRSLPEVAESRRADRRRRPRGLGLLRRLRSALSGRGGRRGLLADHLRSPAWSTESSPISDHELVRHGPPGRRNKRAC